MPTEHFLVVAYDIVSDRRRARLVKVLSGYGVRVNYSVFECRLRAAAIRELKGKIAKIVTRDDSVLFYELCRHCETKVDSQGWREVPSGDPGRQSVIL
jgi:CRISPR-associated protein Cas2